MNAKARQLAEIADHQQLALPEMGNQYAIDALELRGTPGQRAVQLADAVAESSQQLSKYSRDLSTLVERIIWANSKFEFHGGDRKQIRARIDDEYGALCEQANQIPEPPQFCEFGTYEHLTATTTEDAQIATQQWCHDQTREINSAFCASLQASRLVGTAEMSPTRHARYISSHYSVKDRLEAVDRTTTHRTEIGTTRRIFKIKSTHLANAFVHQLTPLYVENALIPSRVVRVIDSLPASIRPCCSVLSGHQIAQLEAQVELETEHWQHTQLTAAGRLERARELMRSEHDPALLLGGSIVLTSWEPQEVQQEMRSPVNLAIAAFECGINWLERRLQK